MYRDYDVFGIILYVLYLLLVLLLSSVLPSPHKMGASHFFNQTTSDYPTSDYPTSDYYHDPIPFIAAISLYNSYNDAHKMDQMWIKKNMEIMVVTIRKKK
eukprot:711290_1